MQSTHEDAYIKKEAAYRKRTHSVFFPALSLEEILSLPSLFTRPYSLFKNKATLQEIITYLQEEKILTDMARHPTRNDIFPYVSIGFSFEHEGRGFGTSSFDTHTTISKALGEGIERFFLHTIHKDTKIHIYQKKWSDMPHLALFPTFLPEQKKMHSFLFDGHKDRDMLLDCAWVKSMYTNKKVLLPLKHIYWRHKMKEGKVFGNQTTNGAGAHFKKDDALLSALLEEIERHVFLLYWFSKKSPTLIDITSLHNEETKRVIRGLQQKDIAVYITLLENEYNVPVIISVLIDTRKKEDAVIGIGGGTALYDIEKAVYAALFESSSSLSASLNNTDDIHHFDKKTYIPFKETKIDRDARVAMWRGIWAEKEIQFLISGTKKEVSTLEKKYESEKKEMKSKEQIKETLSRFKKENIKDVYAYFVDNTHLKRIGYHVAKVIVPEFLQLHLIESTATLNSPLLKIMLGKKEGDKVYIHDINGVPHPFP